MSTSSVAAVYLAREADGLSAFQRFARSYQQFHAGIPHELIVIYKGFEQESSLQAARHVFGELPHTGIELADVGYDIGSYLECSRRIPQTYLCFMNTHTEIASAGWLANLITYAMRGGVGIAGASASYESLRQSWELIQKFFWLYYLQGLPYRDNVARYYVKFRDYLPGSPRNLPGISSDSSSLLAIGKRIAKFRLANIRFRRHWRALIQPGNVLGSLAQFPSFPNPHIRSNGFALHRDRLVTVRDLRIETKDDACLFESGPDSLTARLRRLGLAAVIVGRNGEAYDVPRWSRSETFRLGEQSNLLLTDNHCRSFAEMSQENKATHAYMTWGDYLGPPPHDFPTLGISFRKGSLDPIPEGN